MKHALVVLALLAWACDDDGSAEQQTETDAQVDVAQADAESAEDAGIAEDSGAEPDEGAPPGGGTMPLAGLWRSALQFVDVGGIVLEFQLELAVDPTRSTITSMTLRVLDQDGTVSPDIATLVDVVVDPESSFLAAFMEITLPGEYSPTGTDIVATLDLAGEVRSEDFFCGAVTGRVENLMLDLEMSTFAAVPWIDSGIHTGAPYNCEREGQEGPRPTIGGDRPAQVYLPEAYDENGSHPLVMVLHGYSTTGELQDGYLAVSALQDNGDYVVLLPEGLVDAEGNQFWNAHPACCGDQPDLDDSSYLAGLIDEAVQTYAVDPARIYVVGHSNGAFMGYRMACDHADKIAGIATLAGSAFLNAEDCPAMGRLSVLHLHGTEDASVPYEGRPNQYPSARETTERWAARNGCGAEPVEGEAIEMIEGAEGAETSVLAWPDCEEGTAVELWTHNGVGHLPGYAARFGEVVIPWLLQR